MLTTVLIVLLILMMIGAMPTWGYSRNWGVSKRRDWAHCRDPDRSASDATHLRYESACTCSQLYESKD